MLGVSIETLRRWETDGRLRMERSDGGQRLIEIDEVARLLEERRKASTDRPIVAQSARNRFPGIVTPGRARRRRGRGRGHRRSASDGQPDDGRGGRRARPEGRRRGGLRGQVHERHRRDPVVQGVPGMRSRLPILRRHPGLGSDGLFERGAASPSAAQATARRDVPASVARQRSANRRAHGLRRRVTQGRPRQGQGRLRDGLPRHDRDRLDRFVVGARDADRAGGAGRRLPVGRHDEPEEARGRRVRRWRGRRPSPATS